MESHFLFLSFCYIIFIRSSESSGGTMRLYRNDNTDPSLNLALEEWLVTTATDDCFMLWRNRPAIIVGRNQNAAAEINQDFVQKNNIAVVRRLSGGGAVYHDLGNVNFSFITHGTENKFDFKHFAQPVIGALQSLGVKAEFSGRNDMLIDGKKFSGNAQYVQGSKVLHHGTLLFDSDLTILQQALCVDPSKYESKGVKSVASRVTNIAPHFPAPLSVEHFIEAVLTHMKHNFSGAVFASLTDDDHIGARKLVDSRYGNWDWNFGKSSPYNFHNAQRFISGNIECQMMVEHGIIKSVKVYGDFFGLKPVADIEKQLTGVRHSYQDIEQALADINLAEYFNAIERADIIKVFI